MYTFSLNIYLDIQGMMISRNDRFQEIEIDTKIEILNQKKNMTTINDP